jgi:hypothetical protein
MCDNRFLPRKKFIKSTARRADNFALMVDSNVVRGKWNLARDSVVRNVKLKTKSGE